MSLDHVAVLYLAMSAHTMKSLFKAKGAIPLTRCRILEEALCKCCIPDALDGPKHSLAIELAM